jgi:translation initiation factor 1
MNNIDEFEDFENFDDTKVDIRKQSRNGTKCMTLISGLPTDLDIKKISRHLAKTLQCNASIMNDEKIGKVIKLTGDKIQEVKEFLINDDICKESNIVTHG